MVDLGQSDGESNAGGFTSTAQSDQQAVEDSFDDGCRCVLQAGQDGVRCFQPSGSFIARQVLELKPEGRKRIRRDGRGHRQLAVIGGGLRSRGWMGNLILPHSSHRLQGSDQVT